MSVFAVFKTFIRQVKSIGELTIKGLFPVAAAYTQISIWL